MSSHGRTALVESLEIRACAASHETVVTVANDPTPSGVVLHYAPSERVDTARFDRLRVAVDASRTVVVHGGTGDDRVRVRVVGGGLEIRTTSRQSYVYYRPHAAAPARATTTFSNLFRYGPGEYTTVEIDGGRGRDAIDIGPGLAFNPTIRSIESQAEQTYAPAPAGRTPSDAAARDARWAKRVTAQTAAARSQTADTAFFGDSHILGFTGTGLATWQRYFRDAVNFGIGGDDTRALLYRIDRGLFDVFKPRTVIVSVGTNNFNDPSTGGTDEQVYQGVLRVIDALRETLPDARLVLIGPVPRTGAGLNDRSKALTARLAASAAGQRFEFVDAYARIEAGQRRGMTLVGEDGHYTRQGYKAIGYDIHAILTGERTA